jgi:hypothetical protein
MRKGVKYISYVMEFEKGEQVGYLIKDCTQYILASVVDIHYDDETPYYTIKTLDGREINTIWKRLFKVKEQTRIR